MTLDSDKKSNTLIGFDKTSEIDSKIQSILKPLSNTTRQQLLILLAGGPITYTEIYNQLKLESGSFYWHIKKMDILIQQTEDKKYFLNEVGMKAYQLLYMEGDGVEEMEVPLWVERITFLTNKLTNIPQWIIIQQIIFTVIITAIGLSSVDIIQLGSIPALSENTNFTLTFLSLIGSILFSSLFIMLALSINERRNARKITSSEIIDVFIQILFVNTLILVPGLFSALLVLITDDPSIGLEYMIILPIVFISTVITLMMIMGVIMSNFNYDYKTSLLITLISLYPFFVLSFSLQFFQLS
ncbi:MAG: hypothetical protein ACC656_01700 [Candidatus Heimdallarchaeota archaeon]